MSKLILLTLGIVATFLLITLSIVWVWIYPDVDIEVFTNQTYQSACQNGDKILSAKMYRKFADEARDKHDIDMGSASWQQRMTDAQNLLSDAKFPHVLGGESLDNIRKYHTVIVPWTQQLHIVIPFDVKLGKDWTSCGRGVFNFGNLVRAQTAYPDGKRFVLLDQPHTETFDPRDTVLVDKLWRYPSQIVKQSGTKLKKSSE